MQKKRMAFNFAQWEETDKTASALKLQLQLHYSGQFRIQYAYNTNALQRQ